MNEMIRKMKRGLKTIRRDLISSTRDGEINIYKAYSLSNCFMSVGDIDFYLYWMKSNEDNIDPEFMKMVSDFAEQTSDKKKSVRIAYVKEEAYYILKYLEDFKRNSLLSK